MNDSIYNNAGMPSGQGAAPTMSEDLRRELAHLNFLIEESCTGQATSMTRSWADRIAALTLERDTLKAKVERLSAPVSEWLPLPDKQGWWWHFHGEDYRPAFMYSVMKSGTNGEYFLSYPDSRWCKDVGGFWLYADYPNVPTRDEQAIIAARASTPPPHPINDDEQRRKDAAWNDRVKARCVCGEMIAWYSGEWLHVAGHSKSCADGRLASPAHFLVGMPPA